MIAVVVFFLLSSSRAQNVWAEGLSSEPDVDEEDGLNFWSTWFFPKKPDVCLTQGCVSASCAVLENMNKGADPCENFYEFACGNFIKKTNIPQGEFQVDQFSIIGDKVSHQLKEILEDPSLDNEVRPFRMAKDYYENCMRTNTKEPDFSYINEIVQRMGGWPVLAGDQWDASKFTWQDTVYKFRQEGLDIGYLINFFIGPDLKNNTKLTIQLDQAKLGTFRHFLVRGMEDQNVQIYYENMIYFAHKLGAERDRAAKELKESLDFEIRLAEISMPPENRVNLYSLYNPLTIPQLQVTFPSIPWAEYISKILQKTVELQPDEVVFVRDPLYIKKLENLLATTQKRTQANYMMWRAVYSAVPYIIKTTEGPRWQECTRKLADLPSEGFNIVLSSLYVQRYFKPETKRNALEMVNSIHEEMFRTLKTAYWMDQKTRRYALEKAAAMKFSVAYPEEILDVRKVEDYYQKLEITNGNFLEAKLNLSKFELDLDLRLLRNPVDRTDWRYYTRYIEANAAYNQNANHIYVTAAILQRPLFSHDRPKYMNYGALGYFTGHEITHGFDNTGGEYDKDGNLNNWWDPETREIYIRKAACLIDQAGNYTVKEVGKNINGVHTQGENIADNGGIKLAYRAYNRWAEKHGTEKRLPGLQEFTPRQMFWISAANMYCSKFTPEALSIRMLDVHPPGEFRVQGPFSNRPEFAKDFKCPLGSKMNPYKKCQLW